MNHRTPATAFTVFLVSVAAGTAVAQDGNGPPRTAWGAPDLGGVWDFRSITPMQRPEDLAEQEFLTPEEAAALEQRAVDRESRFPEPARAADGGGRQRRSTAPTAGTARTTIRGWTGARRRSAPGAPRSSSIPRTDATPR